MRSPWVGLGNEVKTLHPSRRGLQNIHLGEGVDLSKELEGRTYYDPEHNPDGLVDLSGATNEIMRDYMSKYFSSFSRNFDLAEEMKYGPVSGPSELMIAMSTFFNQWFNPSRAVEPSEILATNGVSALLDMVAYNVCDSGDGVMVPTPNYSMFEVDLKARAQATIIAVDQTEVPDAFSARYKSDFIEVFEKAYRDAVKRGITVKAVLLSNPNNPVGKFYSEQTLTAIARFCGKYGLHLISDEIYALSSFESPEAEKLPTFTSILSIEEDPANDVSTSNIHAMYGVSKDWGMGGLRLGFLVTRNQKLWKACRRLALFTWLTASSADIFTRFITDRENVENYVHIYRHRLRQKYTTTTAAMRAYGVPYYPANGGLFIWIDLSRWVKYFDESSTTEDTQSIKLCKYLITKAGVHMGMGEQSFSGEPGHYRFIYATPGDEATIAVRRIGVACAELEKRYAQPKDNVAISVRSILEEKYEAATLDDFPKRITRRKLGDFLNKLACHA